MTKPLAIIVEDDPQLSQIFAIALRDDFTVEAIGDGNEALSRLESVAPQLVLLDLHLPGISGVNILQAIRANKQRPQPVVILCTADDRQAEVIQEQADFVLLKPVSPVQLRQIASRVK